MFRPPNAPSLIALMQWAGELVRELNSSGESIPGIVSIDHLDDGGTSRVRIRATSATSKVRVQVQNTAAGKGGAVWSSTDYVSRQDVEVVGWVDLEVARNGSDRYFLFVVPIREARGTSSARVYDGADGGDLIRWVDLGL